MNRRLDDDQLALMAQAGLTPGLAASRLGLSPRTVRRATVRLGLDWHPDPLAGTDAEPVLWRSYARTEGATRAAARFGVSRRRVAASLNSPHS